MAIFETSQGRDVPHCHVQLVPKSPCDEFEFTRAERDERRALLAADFPNVVELRPPSRKYNCHGYAYTDAHGWFEELDLFFADDFSEVPIAEARRGDVLVYEKMGKITHSAIVRRVTGGKIKELRSKWGKWAALIHDPADVPRAYGVPVRLLRRNP